MRIAIPLSLALGLIWHLIAVWLMEGRPDDALRPAWLLAGLFAGLAAGLFTVWSRLRRQGRESLLDLLATYYLGMVAYWAAFVVIERALLCARAGGWTDFDLRDHLSLIVIFFFRGTFSFAVLLLIPLAWISRTLVWKAYGRVTR